MYTTDFAYDGPIFLVPLSPSYPSSPVITFLRPICNLVSYTPAKKTVDSVAVHHRTTVNVLDSNNFVTAPQLYTHCQDHPVHDTNI